MKIENECEYQAALDAIKEYENKPKKFEVGRKYKWINCRWYKGESPPDQGKRHGPLVCVYATDKQGAFVNSQGLHILSIYHLLNESVGYWET